MVMWRTHRAIWTLLCDISRKEFQKVYDRLDVSSLWPPHT